MIIIDDIEQGTDEWQNVRHGIPTASCFDMLITTKGEPSAQYQKYLYTLAGQRITGEKAPSFQSEAMKRGTELEPDARKLFEMVHDVEVKKVGFVYQDDRRLWGCSPDGLMEGCGLELKSPLIHTHIEYLFKNALPTEYKQQVQGSMLITGFSYWWFMSYYPGLKPLILKIQRDDEYCARLKVRLESFVKELDETEKRLRSLL